MEKQNFVNRIFRQVSAFMHDVDLVVIMIIFSVYHYVGAMALHDPVWVVAPFAIGIDLLHFRITVHFCRNLRRWYLWVWPFLITLTIVTGLQTIYYRQPVDDIGTLLPYWQTAVYALIAPTAITLLAILREVDFGVKDFGLALTYARKLKRTERALADSEAAASRLTGIEATVKEYEARLTEYEATVKRYEAAMTVDEAFGQKLEARVTAAEDARALAETAARQSEAARAAAEQTLAKTERMLAESEAAREKLTAQVSRMAEELKDLRASASMVRFVSPLVRDLLLVRTGQKEATQEQIAALHGVSTGTVSNVKKHALNGVGHD